MYISHTYVHVCARSCLHITSVLYNLINICIGPTYNGCPGFLCNNMTRCYSKSVICDGIQDCSDGSDEANCCKS